MRPLSQRLLWIKHPPIQTVMPRTEKGSKALWICSSELVRQIRKRARSQTTHRSGADSLLLEGVAPILSFEYLLIAHLPSRARTGSLKPHLPCHSANARVTPAPHCCKRSNRLLTAATAANQLCHPTTTTQGIAPCVEDLIHFSLLILTSFILHSSDGLWSTFITCSRLGRHWR
eukprot:2720613-Amphidinium_carterae.7